MISEICMLVCACAWKEEEKNWEPMRYMFLQAEKKELNSICRGCAFKDLGYGVRRDLAL